MITVTNEIDGAAADPTDQEVQQQYQTGVEFRSHALQAVCSQKRVYNENVKSINNGRLVARILGTKVLKMWWAFRVVKCK